MAGFLLCGVRDRCAWSQTRCVVHKWCHVACTRLWPFCGRRGKSAFLLSYVILRYFYLYIIILRDNITIDFASALSFLSRLTFGKKKKKKKKKKKHLLKLLTS